MKPKPVKRATEMWSALTSAVRFTDSGSMCGCEPTDESVGYVRLKARVVGEVKVLFRHTLSGL